MCGIFGLFVAPDAEYDDAFITRSLKTLALMSESRGKDCSGLVVCDPRERTINVVKGPVSIEYLLKQPAARDPLEQALEGRRTGTNGRLPFAAVGHSRLVTNGTQLNDGNNQPVLKDGVVGIHNGIIVNDDALYARYPDLRRSFQIDTEVMLALIGKYVDEGWTLASSVNRTMADLVGTVSTAVYADAVKQFALTANNGSLYVLTDEQRFLAFASEEYYLRGLEKELPSNGARASIRQVTPGTGYTVGLDPFAIRPFSRTDSPQKLSASAAVAANGAFRTIERSVSDGRPQREVILDVAAIAAHPRATAEAALLEHNTARIQALVRCSKCLLPETFPFIEYDAQGVCNYCRNYRIRNQVKPIEELQELVRPYRRSDGRPDCLIPYSGGRDSTYALHIAKTVLKLNPIAFTYDWGMVTDLARRNIARTCGKLGVENIIVSADIPWKRENIRRNIQAWLRNPHLGMVPLFMAGDKFFFYYTSQVKKQTGIRLNIWGINPLENTDFKVGFLGVPPDFNKERIYSLSARRQVKMLSGIVKVLIGNPRYLNRSVWDSLGAHASRYLAPRSDYYHMYDYVRWDEKTIDDLLWNEYEWEKAVDTDSTWRIGDGTAAFYNYIYYTVAGFSEYDTFRSNQIREGMITREEGARLVERENRPRYASLKWYTDIVGLDFASTIGRINAIPKLYR